MVIIKRETKPILQDGVQPIPYINGKIIKIIVKANRPMENVNVRIIGDLYEEIINHKISNILNIWRPFYFNQEQILSPESSFTDYFYIESRLDIEIRGITQGDIIEQIQIFYEE